MGRSYNMPSDTGEAEKAIGGLLTFKQFFWLLAGFILGLIFFAVMFLTTKNLTVSIFFIFLGLGITGPFAFIKKYNMTLFTYLKYKRLFKKKSKKLINMRKEYVD